MTAGGPGRSGMDATHARVALRERALFDVLDLALRFLVENGRHYALTAAVVLPPCVLLTYAVGAWGSWWLGWPFAMGLATIAQAPFTALAGRLVFAPSTRARDALGDAASALPRVVLARALQFAGVAAGALVLLLPGVWLAVRFFFVGEVVQLERAGVVAAFSRAQRIIGGFSGDALSALFTLTVLHLGVVLIGDVAGREVISSLLEFQPPAPMWTTGGSVLAAAAFWAFVPFVATAKLFVYLDVRTRTEGWDVQARFLSLSQRARAKEALA